MPLNLLLSEKFILDFRRRRIWYSFTYLIRGKVFRQKGWPPSFSVSEKIDDFVQGTGLGLTICRMLVEKMGGRIWVRSKQGEGTVFYFTLPMAK
mgnify:CR=1 FL=1